MRHFIGIQMLILLFLLLATGAVAQNVTPISNSTSVNAVTTNTSATANANTTTTNATPSQAGTITLEVVSPPQSLTGWLVILGVVIGGLFMYWLILKVFST